jgi:putative exosortase-associated protein (TIGR04073 family)
MLVVLGAATQAQADDQSRKRKDISLMFKKLGRGTMNVLVGWVEVPKNISLRWKETDPLSGTVWGGFEGIAWGFARTVGGVYEIVSFPFPYPENYDPLIEPEFILTPIWGDPAPWMTDEPINPADSFEE